MSSPCCNDWNVPPMTPVNPASPAPNANTQQKDQLHADAGGREHVAIVDAGADQHADPGAVERQPHQDADDDRAEKNDEAHQRILQIDVSRRSSASR